MHRPSPLAGPRRGCTRRAWQEDGRRGAGVGRACSRGVGRACPRGVGRIRPRENTEAVRKEDIEAVREENIKVHRKDAAEGARQDEIEGIIQVNVATEFARTKETTMMNAPTMGFYEMAASKEFDPKIAVIQAVPSNSTVPMVLAPKAPVPERIVEQDGRQDIVLEHEKLAPQHTTEDRARNDDAHDDGTREEPACGSVVVMDAFAKDKLDSNVNAPQE